MLVRLSDPAPTGVARSVGCTMGFDLVCDSVLALQVAPATSAGELVTERMEITVDGMPPATPVVELAGPLGARTHVVTAGAGRLHIAYSATVRTPVPGPPPPAGDRPFDHDDIEGLRPSRYCPSDAVRGFAATELGDLAWRPELARSIAAWVFERLDYESGASSPLDTAVDTLLAGAGVCRDFAHLTIALCRAMGVPTRLAAVYAPGLSPMDFHAVVEARRGTGWEVLDPTRRAPRSSLVRIATGRDAADTAFATTLRGEAELLYVEVTAVVEGNLPDDDHVAAATLA